MLRSPSRFRWLVALLGLLAARPVLAVAPVIKDEGKFFSAEAIQKANEGIREIARQTGRDLLVETFPSVPADQVEKVKAMSADERAEFWRTWARQRADQAVVNGVYILVCRTPSHLYVEVTPKARSVFGADAAGRLRSVLLENFRSKRYDDGLLAAVKLVRDQFAQSKPPADR